MNITTIRCGSLNGFVSEEMKGRPWIRHGRPESWTITRTFSETVWPVNRAQNLSTRIGQLFDNRIESAPHASCEGRRDHGSTLPRCGSLPRRSVFARKGAQLLQLAHILMAAPGPTPRNTWKVLPRPIPRQASAGRGLGLLKHDPTNAARCGCTFAGLMH